MLQVNMTDTRKSWDKGKDVEIFCLKLGDIEITNTSGAEALTGYSTSQISKLCRPSKDDNGKKVAPEVESTFIPGQKGRVISIASLKDYWDNKRRQPSTDSQRSAAYQTYSESVAKIVSGKKSNDNKVKEIAALTLALESELARLAKIDDSNS